MTSPGNPLPANVLAAVERGELIEAIKLLRQASGLGLKEAKDVIEAHQRGEPVSLATAATASSHTATHAASTLPPAVADALRRGNKLEAIKWLHSHAGLDLKTAKEQVDALAAHSAHSAGAKPHPSSTPGLTVMPRGGGTGRWLILLVIAGLIAYVVLHGQA